MKICSVVYLIQSLTLENEVHDNFVLTRREEQMGSLDSRVNRLARIL